MLFTLLLVMLFVLYGRKTEQVLDLGKSYTRCVGSLQAAVFLHSSRRLGCRKRSSYLYLLFYFRTSTARVRVPSFFLHALLDLWRCRAQPGYLPGAAWDRSEPARRCHAGRPDYGFIYRPTRHGPPRRPSRERCSVSHAATWFSFRWLLRHCCFAPCPSAPSASRRVVR